MHFVTVAFHVQSIKIVLIVKVVLVERLVELAAELCRVFNNRIVQLIILEVNISVQVNYHRIVNRAVHLTDLAYRIDLVRLVQLIVRLVVRLAIELLTGQIDRFTFQRVH